jgi:predicted acetyltransferase
VSIEIRIAEPGERIASLRPIWHYFGGSFGPEEDRAERMLIPDGRMHVAVADGEIVGGAGAFQFDITTPGGPVRAAGPTVVGVLPTHRRRGVLRELMRAQLDDVHERGEPIAVLWASDGRIYGRFGYGLASICGDLGISRDHAGFAAPVEWDGAPRLVDAAEAATLFPRVYEQVRPVTPGLLSRRQDWWEKRTLADSEWRRDGGGELAYAVLERDGVPEAYALYRLNFSYTDGVPSGKVVVLEAMGISPAATAAVWRFLLDIDWMATIEAELLPVDHPLLLLVAEQGRMNFRVGDGLWARLVDVGAALAARGYAGEDELVFAVSDSFCPWNDACFSLDGVKTMSSPDLRLSVDALGSTYLGGFTFSDLLRAGRVEELTEGAIARADALFRADRKPWCPEIF